jgi:plastocyanin
MARSVIVLVAVFALGLSACSSDEGGGPTGTPSATGTTTGPTGAIGEGCVDLTGEDPATVTISGFAFQPDCFTMNASQVISIVNEDDVMHSFTIDGTQVDGDFEGGSTWVGPGPISGVLASGTHDFYCKYHDALTGTVTVQ